MAILILPLPIHTFFKRPQPHHIPSNIFLAESHFTVGENEAPGIFPKPAGEQPVPVFYSVSVLFLDLSSM